MRYGGRAVAGASEVVENSVEAVRDAIQKMRRAIEKTSDDDWKDEEVKRKKWACKAHIRDLNLFLSPFRKEV